MRVSLILLLVALVGTPAFADDDWSPTSYEYAPRGVLLRPFSFQAWDIPVKHGKLYLRAKFIALP
ncbi:MAG TPA: hypothetical protein VGF94_17120 [Kofleriaceae bacterium]|jgi:hypothetical protein